MWYFNRPFNKLKEGCGKNAGSTSISKDLEDCRE